MPEPQAPQTPLLLKVGLGLGGALALLGLFLTIRERIETGAVQSWWLPVMSAAALALAGVCIAWLMRLEAREPK